MTNLLKPVLVVILSFMLPMSQAYAVVPDVNLLLSDVTEQKGTIADINISLPNSENVQIVAPHPDFTVASIILSNNQILEENVIEMQDATEEDELLYSPLVSDDHHFWTRGKMIIASTIALSTGLLLSLVFLLSSSGGGSGSGSGSNSNPGGGTGGGPNPGGNGNPGPDQSGLNNENPNSDIPTVETDNENLFLLAGGDNPNPDNSNLDNVLNDLINDGGKGTLPVSGVPHNPEPSTLLLMGLGLLVPFLRKRLS